MFTYQIYQVAKDAVDLENPPNTKLFDADYCNDSDVTLLSRHQHCLAAADQNVSNSTPSIVIQNDFEGLVGLCNTALPPSAPTSVQSEPYLKQPALVPKMALGDFCDKFDLSIYILQKLDTLKITGHVLQFITNQHLVEFGGLNIGELADV